MATTYWLGIADAVAKQMDVTVGGSPSGETYSILVNGQVIATYVDTDTLTTTIATSLATNWNASTNVYATQITATANGSVVELVADNAGEEFTVTVNTPGGAGTLSAAVTTANAGPHDWSTAGNWSEGSVPGAGDIVIIAEGSVSILWGLDQNGTTIAELIHKSSHTGRIGLNPNIFLTSADESSSSTVEKEYRQTYLDINCASIEIGVEDSPVTTGSGRVKIDNSATTAAYIDIHSANAPSSDAGLPAVRVAAQNAAVDVNVRKAQHGVLIGSDDYQTQDTFGDIHVQGNDTTEVFVTGEVTWTNVRHNGGDLLLRRNGGTGTLIVQSGGTLTTEGSWTVTTFTVADGTCYPNNYTGVAATMNYNGGLTDFTRSNVARSVTTAQIKKDATLIRDPDIITFTNELAFVTDGGALTTVVS